MKRLNNLILILLALFTQAGHTADYDPLLLRTQASIFPKIILLDRDIESKISENEIIISIVHTENDHADATILKKLMEKKLHSALRLKLE